MAELSFSGSGPMCMGSSSRRSDVHRGGLGILLILRNSSCRAVNGSGADRVRDLQARVARATAEDLVPASRAGCRCRSRSTAARRRCARQGPLHQHQSSTAPRSASHAGGTDFCPTRESGEAVGVRRKAERTTFHEFRKHRECFASTSDRSFNHGCDNRSIKKSDPLHSAPAEQHCPRA